MFEELLRERTALSEQLQVPELPSSLDFLLGGPLSFSQELKGKLTVLFFWNYRCIHSDHGIHWLIRCVQSIADSRLVIVGIHVGLPGQHLRKEAVLAAAQQHAFPGVVAHDHGAQLAKAFNVDRLPTLAIIGPEGNVIHAFIGEEWRYELHSFLRECLSFYGEAKWCLAPIDYSVKTKTVAKALSYPTAIVGDGDRFYVSDTGQNSIVALSADGQWQRRIGALEAGFTDGSFEELRFRGPRGLYLRGNKLFVADTGNHAIRLIDLEAQTGVTLWGIGDLGLDYAGGQDRRFQRLSSPWDLCMVKDELWVAMAGTHQIWRMEPNGFNCLPCSGTGCQVSLDHPETLAASWAFPSAITLMGAEVLVAEAGAHRIRALDLKKGGTRVLIDAREGLRTPAALLWQEELGRLLIAARDGPGLWAWDAGSCHLAPLSLSQPLCEPVGLAQGPLGPEQLFVVDHSMLAIISIVI